MSRISDFGASADPLQPRRGKVAARAESQAPFHSLHAGLVAIAPRLVGVILLAGAIQLLLGWIHH
ncbi:hypothetical protein [Rhizobium sp. BK251]|uniref:hypothetical protein n=1 Tax=Rhizobium sp. BK251 TaxID=2512125 RepID=UPI001050ACF0|nr:hypothetical protein [Rhizobium sp. BK251]TCL67138.1 hypothetical protein EV286_11039 [Rhizobium sp. BK251]